MLAGVLHSLQAPWLPKQYKSGTVFRAAARYRGAPFKLQQLLAHGSGAENAMYLSRRMGVGSSVSIMQWEVSQRHLAMTHVVCAMACVQRARSRKHRLFGSGMHCRMFDVSQVMVQTCLQASIVIVTSRSVQSCTISIAHGCWGNLRLHVLHSAIAW